MHPAAALPITTGDWHGVPERVLAPQRATWRSCSGTLDAWLVRHFGGASSHVRLAVLALALTNVTVDSLKASALFDLLAPPLHMPGFGVVLS
jgi:hypothetical protein